MKYQIKQSEFINAVAEMSIHYNVKVKAKDRKKCEDPEKMSEIFRSVYDDSQIELIEKSYAMFMNRNFQVLGILNIGEGCTTETIMDVRRIIQGALLCNASVVSICHNHPSGSLTPSFQDKSHTKTIKNACSAVGLHFIDHIIINADGEYYSFRDEGLL